MKKQYGMPLKDWVLLGKMLHIAPSDPPETVLAYIDRTGAKTETRISKRGVELIKVFYPNSAKEYEKSKIGRISAQEW